MLTLLMPPTCPTDGDSASKPTKSRTLKVRTGAAWLLVEAIDLAERFGCKVIETELEGDEQPGLSWHQGRKQLWLDLNDPPAWRLSTLADALRGEAGLFYAKMSPELADYLAPRRAA